MSVNKDDMRNAINTINLTAVRFVSMVMLNASPSFIIDMLDHGIFGIVDAHSNNSHFSSPVSFSLF